MGANILNKEVLLLPIFFIMIVIVVWLMMAKNITEFLFLMLIILLIIVMKLVIQTPPKIYRFFNVFNQKKSFNLDRIFYLCSRLRDNIPLIFKIMILFPGELRFCEDCIHRLIVNGLQNNEIWCKRHGHRLGNGSEANQCILSNDFVETDVSKENRKDFHVKDYDNILLS